MSTTFTLAHLSDVHLQPMPPIGLGHWRPKRVLGYANWYRNRKGVHLRQVVDQLVADMAEQKSDHIAVTGDLVNIGLPQEHAWALEWLRSLGPPDQVSVIPGNHDIYVRLPRDPGAMRWRDYMTSNAEGVQLGASNAVDFPFVRRFGNVALVGVNSAVPMPPIIAAGRVGHEQRARLAYALDALGREGLVRIVLIHHPPLPGQAAWSRGLRDAAELKQILTTHGAELVLHGHNHTNTLAACHWKNSPVPVVGIASASIGRAYKDEPLGRYNLIRIQFDEGGHRIEIIGRGLTEPGGGVVELERRWLDTRAPVAS
ncbi:MAG: metallophosphoesterase [Hyphomicrobiaceae bacterium]|jgi:3',5'-cyclic AMP phosphodiesterase CpdA